MGLSRVSKLNVTLLGAAVAALAIPAWAAPAPTGELQAFLDKSKTYAALPKVAYQPKFSLEPYTPGEHAKGTQWFYIRDGEQRIGLIQTWTKEIELFQCRPTPAGQKAKAYDLPHIYHWANLLGARIEMYGIQGVPPEKSFKLTFTKDQGEALEFKTEHTHQGDITGSSEYRLAWDARLGYVIHGVTRFAMPEPRELEFNNLLAGGIADSRPKHKRWQKTIRAVADGRVSYVWHSPLNIPVDAMHPRGYIGFVTEEDLNPFVELLETTCPVSIGTCSQWYDQHIRMQAPKEKGADGLYHMQARYRFLSLPGALAKELEAIAVNLKPPEKADSGLTGFLQNQVNDFETGVPTDKLYIGPIWQHINATAEGGHSGKMSIKVGGGGPGKVNTASPIGGGPALYGETGKRYRLAGWVKTQGLKDGGAYLEIDDVFFNWEDQRATRRTEKITGDSDWKRLAVEFTPSAHDPLFYLKLCVEGTGTAWFDDLELMDVTP